VTKAEYAAYLESPEWAWKRYAILEYYNYTCAVCGYWNKQQGVSAMHVHHLTYARVGNERPSDLQVLCNTCHTATHKRRGVWVSPVRIHAEELWFQGG
jgi:5-methylcytosine-specific restriction endonuclease McrA